MSSESGPLIKPRAGTPSKADDAREQAGNVAAMVPEEAAADANVWTARLVLFLRVMAVLFMAKGLYQWAQITGFVGSVDESFEAQPTGWQSATVYFAVIDLVAAVGLWLATPWGAVVWLTTVVSLAVIDLMFPAVYGQSAITVIFAVLLLSAYLGLAWMAARERPP